MRRTFYRSQECNIITINIFAQSVFVPLWIVPQDITTENNIIQ